MLQETFRLLKEVYGVPASASILALDLPEHEMTPEHFPQSSKFFVHWRLKRFVSLLAHRNLVRRETLDTLVFRVLTQYMVSNEVESVDTLRQLCEYLDEKSASQLASLPEQPRV